MIRFNTKIGAAVLIGAAVVYMVVSLALGRNARADRGPELRADEAGLDVFQAASLIIRESPNTVIVDMRDKASFDLYHVPHAVSLPSAGLSKVQELASGKAHLLVVAETDKDASSLVGAMLAGGGAKAHFLKGGSRSWYLAFDLPVALFSDKPMPYGYNSSLALARSCLTGPCADTEVALGAVTSLAMLAYEPTMFQGKKQGPAASAGKKKISGGCGG